MAAIWHNHLLGSVSGIHVSLPLQLRPYQMHACMYGEDDEDDNEEAEDGDGEDEEEDDEKGPTHVKKVPPLLCALASHAGDTGARPESTQTLSVL